MLKLKLFSNYYNFLEKVSLLVNHVSIATKIFNIFAGSFRVSLFIDLGCPRDLGKEWRGDLGTFMISRPI